MQKLKRAVLTILCTALLFSLLPAAHAANPTYSDWFRSSLLEMQNLKLMPASMEGKDLTQRISRAEMCELAVRAYEQITEHEIELESETHFTDTTDKNILKAFELGIVSGYPDGRFRPGEALTRQQFFQIMKNLCNAAAFQPSPSGTDLKAYRDANSVAVWASEAARICVKYGYVTGTQSGEGLVLEPNRSTTREEAMAMFLRCFKSVNEYYYYVKNAKVTKDMYVTASSLNVRATASQSGTRVGTLSSGVKVTVLEMLENGWAQIVYQGATAYVYAPHLADYAAGSGAASSDALKITNLAMTFVGYPYVYGGKSPAGGFDCSGLVYYCFAQCGHSIRRVADDQMNQGSPVAIENLQAGDLVFFGSGTYANHVGIYIGNHNFVHASTPKSGVRISSLKETYYATRYIGARRVV